MSETVESSVIDDATQSTATLPKDCDFLKLPRAMLTHFYRAILWCTLPSMVTLLTTILLLRDAIIAAVLYYWRFFNPVLYVVAFPNKVINMSVVRGLNLKDISMDGDVIRAATGYIVSYVENASVLFKVPLPQKLRLTHVQKQLFDVFRMFLHGTQPVLSLYESVLKKHVRCVRFLRRLAERRHVGKSNLYQIQEGEEGTEEEVSPTKSLTERPKRKREDLVANMDVASPTSPAYVLAPEQPESVSANEERNGTPAIEIQPPTDEAEEAGEVD